MIHVDLPYDYGTFMKAKDKETGDVIFCGTVVAYTVCDDGWLVWVSGYRESCCGEFLPEEVEPMTELEIEDLMKKYGEV